MPMAWAALMACSAANRAAKGVLLRDPLNPEEPALPQQTVLPCVSVTVTIVLLKDAKTCTWAVCKARLDLRVDDVRRDERTV